MDRQQIVEALNDVFDQALVFHAFTDYMRDYEMVFYVGVGPGTGAPPQHLRYVFRYCVEATVHSSVSPQTWRTSLDERFISYETGAGLDGFVWGVKWQEMYPGAELLPNSGRASSWENALPIPFYEAVIETNAHRIALVFSDLDVQAVEIGYAPFRVCPRNRQELWMSATCLPATWRCCLLPVGLGADGSR